MKAVRDSISPTTSTSPSIIINLRLESIVIMANPESPDPATDLVPVATEEEEVDPLAPAPEPKLPTRKDASLKEFLGKMDDYAPIVSPHLTSSITFLIHLLRFQMLSPTTTLQKLACHHHLKLMSGLLAFLRSQLKSSSPTLQQTRINTLGFGHLIPQMQIILWAI